MIFSIPIFLFSTCLPIIWSLFIFLFVPFYLKLYKISDQNKVCIAMKKLPKRSSIIEDENLRGWIFGMPYIGYIHEIQQNSNFSSNNMYVIYILTTEKYFKEISEHANNTITTNKSIINIYERLGNYFYLHYEKRILDVTHFIPKNNQIKSLKIIKNLYLNSIENNKPHLCVILYGKSGVGKSVIPILLAKELKCSLSNSFNPTEPGDMLSRIYNTACPTYDNPLIIVLEEFDIYIKKLYNNEIKLHKHIPIEIYDKTTWNLFFDKIDRNIYPYLIVILTTNKNPEYINNLDKSFIRSGRIDISLEVIN